MQEISVPPPKNEHQRSVNDCWSCILDNQWAVQMLYSITNIVAAIIGKNGNAHLAITP
jgi:hypothetical protein